MRIRTIKPTFWTNDALAELPALTRLLFIGLWNMADVRGRLEDRPKRIKAAVLPYDDHDVDEALTALATAGFVVRYQVGNMAIIQIVNFEKHQRISGKEAECESDFPGQPSQIQPVETGEAPGKHPGSTRVPVMEGRKEGKGREENPPPIAREAAEQGPEATPPGPSSVVPTDEEVLAWARSWPGMPAVGIPPGIPEAWVLGWLAFRSRPGQAPMGDWRREAALRFRSDWQSNHPKARPVPAGEKKAAATSATAVRIAAENRVKTCRAAVEAADQRRRDVERMRGSVPSDELKRLRASAEAAMDAAVRDLDGAEAHLRQLGQKEGEA